MPTTPEFLCLVADDTVVRNVSRSIYNPVGRQIRWTYHPTPTMTRVKSPTANRVLTNMTNLTNPFNEIFLLKNRN